MTCSVYYLYVCDFRADHLELVNPLFPVPLPWERLFIPLSTLFACLKFGERKIEDR